MLIQPHRSDLNIGNYIQYLKSFKKIKKTNCLYKDGHLNGSCIRYLSFLDLTQSKGPKIAIERKQSLWVTSMALNIFYMVI